MDNAQLYLGNCLEVMQTMGENSVDTIVTDPPYMIGFMGKAFDKAKDNPAASIELWAECLRVAKPGAIPWRFAPLTSIRLASFNSDVRLAIQQTGDIGNINF